MGNSLRIAKQPLDIPAGVEAKWNAPILSLKGKHGQVEYEVSSGVAIVVEAKHILVSPENTEVKSALVATTRVLLGNMIQGVHQMFERKLLLVGVGFRAKMQGNVLELSIGFSHPVIYTAPPGIKIEVVNNTEIVVKGIDKRLVGQVAADIRRFRPPDSYKGKGVRYADEKIHLKETKKK